MEITSAPPPVMRSDGVQAYKAYHAVTYRDAKGNLHCLRRIEMQALERRRGAYVRPASHWFRQVTRLRERRMKRFKSPSQAQQLLSAHSPITSTPTYLGIA